jgi:hypothetical protein
MPTVKFMGFVTPRVMSIGTSGGPYIFQDEAIGQVSMVYSITDDAISAESEIDEVNDDTVTVLYWWVSSFIDIELSILSPFLPDLVSPQCWTDTSALTVHHKH